jgi:hypothetical protein
LNLGILEIILIVVTVIFLVLTIVWVIALLEILKSEFKNNNKIIWLLTVMLVPFIGAIIYLIIGRNQRIPPEKNA